MTLRQIVNKTAKEKKVSVASVARSIGMTSQAFNSYLRGNPRIDNLIKIAKALDVDPKILMIRNDYELEKENLAAEAQEPWQYPEQPNQKDDMSELEFYKKQNELLEKNSRLQEEKILRLETELKQCQESNRVHAHT